MYVHVGPKPFQKKDVKTIKSRQLRSGIDPENMHRTQHDYVHSCLKAFQKKGAISNLITTTAVRNRRGEVFRFCYDHFYLSEIISGGVTYQNNFTEIIINFMQEPYTSGIGQIMQK